MDALRASVGPEGVLLLAGDDHAFSAPRAPREGMFIFRTVSPS